MSNPNELADMMGRVRAREASTASRARTKVYIAQVRRDYPGYCLFETEGVFASAPLAMAHLIKVCVERMGIKHDPFKANLLDQWTASTSRIGIMLFVSEWEVQE